MCKIEIEIEADAKLNTMNRTLKFPENYAVGDIFVENGGMPTFLGEARGQMEVQENDRVKLVINDSGAVTLEWMLQLPPDALYSLSAYARTIDVAELQKLAVLKGLRELDLGQLKPVKQQMIYGAGGEATRVPAESSDVDNALSVLRLLPNLTRLLLGESGAGDGCLQYVRNLSQLELLDIEHTTIGDAAISNLTSLSTLKMLDLEGCPIGDAGLAQVCCCQALEMLDIDETLVTDVGITYLAHMKSLRWLRAANNYITGASVHYLQNLPRLDTLELSGPQVTDASVPSIATLKGLTELLLINTSVSEAGIAQLSAALPNCHIDRR